MRRIWIQRTLFLLGTLSALAGFEIYNQTFRIYHVVSATLDLGIPVKLELYGTNRSTMRQIIRMLHAEFPDRAVPEDRPDLRSSRSDVALAAATLDRCVESIGALAERFSVQSLGIAVVRDSASQSAGIPLHLSHESVDCGEVVIRSGAARCMVTQDGPVLVTGNRARDLIESE